MGISESYTTLKSLSSTHHCEVYRARRESDGLEVVLKRYSEDRSDELRPRALRELEALRAVEPGCAVRALDLDRGAEPPVLVLEEFPGLVPPRRSELASFLEFAVRAAQALAGVHRARWVHHNLQPDNFLVHPRTGEVRLVGFGRAAPFGAPAADRPAGALATPLRYMSPEQSGRLERGVDFRSDLYALGAVLYELLTGLPVFGSSDALELIQAHLAGRPRSPLELRPELPPTLARIILRLLEKEPEDRYQTAEALQVDLDSCREQLARTGRIDDTLPLGTADEPYRPLFRRTLYGREAEVQTLLAAYRRAAAGARERVAIGGAAGIGKSALVPELHRPLALDGGYLAQGKFDLYRRHVPHAGFASAFRSLAEQIASESEARIEAWRRALLAQLGPIAAALLELVPELAPVLGEVAAVPALPPQETQARLALAVQRFVRAAAAHARAFVLFLDDLQWADGASLELLDALVSDAACGHCLLICTYRDQEVAPDHRFARLLVSAAERGEPFHTLALAPISEQATAHMLAEALRVSPEQTVALAAEVARKSGNVPLLIQHCVYHLHRLGLIVWKRGQGWVWDDAAIRAAALPDDPQAMMIAKLQQLPAEARRVIELASCVGDSFETETLLELRQMDRGTLEAALYSLSDDGLIAPSRSGFQFVHDRIREAAQRLLSSVDRSALHREAAELLLSRLPESERAERIFELADHLLLAPERTEERLRQQALQVYHQAGRRALQCGASASALRYFEAAMAEFRESDWESRFELGFSIWLQAAESAMRAEQFERALEWIGSLERRPLDIVHAAQVTDQKLVLRIVMLGEDDPRGLDHAFEALDRFGLRWPRHPSFLRLALAFLATDWTLRGPLDEVAFRPLDPVREPTRQARHRVFRAAAGTLASHSPPLFYLLLMYDLRSMRRFGYTVDMPVSLATLAVLSLVLRRRIRDAHRYAEAAVAWSERLGGLQQRARTDYLLYGHLYPHLRPRRTLLGGMRAAAERLLELGDLQYATYAYSLVASASAVVGLPFDRLEAPRRLLAQGNTTGPAALDDKRLFFRLLREPLGAAELDAWIHTTQSQLDARPTARFGDWIFWAIVLAVSGRFEDVLAAADQAGLTARFGPFGADLQFFEGVAAAALVASPDHAPRRRALQQRLRRALRSVEAVARYSPDFQHMAQGLGAERARLQGKSQEALELLLAAAEQAQRQEYHHHAAFLHERRAALLDSLGRREEGGEARNVAARLYEAWGATAKVAALRTLEEAAPQPGGFARRSPS